MKRHAFTRVYTLTLLDVGNLKFNEPHVLATLKQLDDEVALIPGRLGWDLPVLTAKLLVIGRGRLVMEAAVFEARQEAEAGVGEEGRVPGLHRGMLDGPMEAEAEEGEEGEGELEDY